MDEIINLINNSHLTKNEYDNIHYIINNKIKNINKNEYSNNLLISIKNYVTNNIILLDFINNVNNINVHYDEEDIVCIYLEYVDYNIELTINHDEVFFSDQYNDEIKILEIYKKNKINHVCFYNNHEEQFIKTLEWNNLITPEELYLFFKFIFNSLPNHLYNKW